MINRLYIYLYYISITAIGLALPLRVYGQENEYIPLVSLPGVSEGSGAVPLGEYLSNLFIFLISLTTILAVIMVTVGGIQWLTAGDSEDKVKRAKDKIKGAIGGILLAGASWIILNTINPTLLSLTIGGQNLDLRTSVSIGVDDFEIHNPSDQFVVAGQNNETVTFPVVGAEEGVGTCSNTPLGMTVSSSNTSIVLQGNVPKDVIPAYRDRSDPSRRTYQTYTTTCSFTNEEGRTKEKTAQIQVNLLDVDNRMFENKSVSHVKGNILVDDRIVFDNATGALNNSYYLQFEWQNSGRNDYYYYGPYRSFRSCMGVYNEISEQSYYPATGPQRGSECVVNINHEVVQELFTHNSISENDNICNDWSAPDSMLVLYGGACDTRENIRETW